MLGVKPVKVPLAPVIVATLFVQALSVNMSIYLSTIVAPPVLVIVIEAPIEVSALEVILAVIVGVVTNTGIVKEALPVNVPALIPVGIE